MIHKNKNNKSHHLIFLATVAFLSIIFVQFSVAQLIDKEKLKATNDASKILEKLLPEGSDAPETKGLIYYKKQNKKIKSVQDFEKDLKKYTINFKGKITILQFWDKECKYCKLALSKLEKIHKKYKNKGIQCFALNSNNFTDKENFINFLNDYHNIKLEFDPETNQLTEEKDLKYFKSFNIPILFIDKKQQYEYGVEALPALFIIDKSGTIFTAMIGYFEEYENWLDEMLTSMITAKKQQ